MVASHRRMALCAIASKTGWASVGELEITRRISAVAVCCSTDSVSALLMRSTSVFSSAYDAVVGLTPFKGLAQSSQNLAVGRFSCWHRGHFMPRPSQRLGRERSEGYRKTSLAAGRGQDDPAALQHAAAR